MKKILSSVIILVALVVGLGSVPITSQAAIYDGGGSGRASGTNSERDKYNIEWGFGTSLYDYAWNNSSHPNHNWGNRAPVYNLAKYNYGGASSVYKAVLEAQPACAKPGVQAVFGVQNVAKAPESWKQLVYSVNSKIMPEKSTYSELLRIYKARMGSNANPSIVSQLKAKGNETLPVKTVFCVDKDAVNTGDNPPLEDWEPGKPEYDEDGFEIECVYSRTAEVTLQKIPSKNGKEDPIGNDNLHTQEGITEKTPFGKLVDKYTTATRPIDINTAITELSNVCEDTTTHPTIDLDDKNKEGIAEGGVLNVKETEKKVTFGIPKYKTLKSCKDRKKVSNDDRQTWTYTGETRDCIEDHPERITTGDTLPSIVPDPTPPVSGMWQMISVNCNPEDFKALEATTPGINIIKNGEVDGGHNYLAYTQKYDGVPSPLDFGDSNNPNPVNAKTADVSFYEKDCPFECTPDKNGEGASDENTGNGARDNIRNEGAKAGDKYGAKSVDLNHNNFTFFRDNEENNIKVDTWYPKNGVNGVIYETPGSAPITTKITRWAEGTPNVTGESGGKFEMKSSKGQKLFLPNIQEGTEEGYISSSTTHTELDGLHREFTVKSTWASDADKPQVLNIGWQYEPDVKTEIYSNGLGVSETDIVYDLNPAISSGKVPGVCYANYGVDEAFTILGEIPDNSDSSSTTPSDTLIQGPDQDAETNLIVKFVRSTTE